MHCFITMIYSLENIIYPHVSYLFLIDDPVTYLRNRLVVGAGEDEAAEPLDGGGHDLECPVHDGLQPWRGGRGHPGSCWSSLFTVPLSSLSLSISLSARDQSSIVDCLGWAPRAASGQAHFCGPSLCLLTLSDC